MTAVSGQPSTILVIKHGAFGDLMQSEGALHDIRDNFPNAVITILTTPPYRLLLERCPWVDDVLTDPRDSRWRVDRMWALAGRLRAGQFQFVIDLQNSARTAWYRRWFLPKTPWSGSGARHGWGSIGRDLPATKTTLERLAEQLRRTGLVVRHTKQPDLSWMADDVTGLLAAAGIDRPFVVLIPGSSARHPQKRWPHFPELARLLDRRLAVVTAPGPDEMALVETMPGTILTRPGGYLSWFELAGLFKRAAFVVGNDTGPTHLAAHVGAPGLALFGAGTPPHVTGILRADFEALAVPDLKALSVERVAAAVAAALGRQGAPA